ncbi:hypothetical protein NLI96_g2717 [Meripilus lineatus]|uniref:Uncharacterized protein n=1 Tax=Meripilus lineatus TaxID=2056292 RepID=A0AAD5V852_9APHY|nr:hypothetical protein NLI96_g2717 [Physisporinus lineatus]
MAFLAYNEFGLSEHWLSKNLLNAIGYAAFEVGAVVVALSGEEKQLDYYAVKAVTISSLLIFTTIQSQDFKDEEGDRACGRKTVAILYPKVGRISLSILITAWAIVLPVIWHAPVLVSLLFLLMGVGIAVRFLALRDTASDRSSFMAYNVSIRDSSSQFKN